MEANNAVSFKNSNRCNFYFTITSLSFWEFPVLCLSLSTPPLTWRSPRHPQLSGLAPRLTCTPGYSACLLLMERNPRFYCQSPQQHGFLLLVHSHSQLLTLSVISAPATALALRHTLLYSWSHTFAYALPALWNAHSQRVMKLEIRFFPVANHSNPRCFPLVFFLFLQVWFIFLNGYSNSLCLPDDVNSNCFSIFFCSLHQLHSFSLYICFRVTFLHIGGFYSIGDPWSLFIFQRVELRYVKALDVWAVWTSP